MEADISAVVDGNPARAGGRKAGREPRFFDRELSWLDFNERVLAIAATPTTPVLERAKFLAIFADNLDEFYMVRVAGLQRQVVAGVMTRSPSELTPREQLAAIAKRVAPMAKRHARLFADEVMPALAESGVNLKRWGALASEEQKELVEFFTEWIFPVLTPLAVDPGRPFPYISNLSLNLAVLVRDSLTDRLHFARVKVPPSLPRFISTSRSDCFVPLEDVIAANLDELFPGMEVIEHHSFRVTRDGDLEVNDGADDLLEAVEEELRNSRFSPAVRLEVEGTMPKHILDLLKKELQVKNEHVHMLPGPLGLSGLWGLYENDRPDLKDEPFQPVTRPELASPQEDEADLFEVLHAQDVLVQHPYDSFGTSVQRLIEQAAADPDVLAIKQTLYRTAGSPIVSALVEAAEAGKQVVVLVEIKARFDERANITWARTLERAGCHIVHGLVGLKTHCKLCLIVRREGDSLTRYVHVGTGNYNPVTARIYEDVGLLTSDPRIGAEVGDLFNYLTGFSRKKRYRSLIVAPHGMRDEMIALIGREAALSKPDKPGRIVMKLNNLVDPEVIDALYDASGKGVSIDLVVRGVSALRPGVVGLSERITVRSIVGRFLEHSRIYYFQNGGKEKIYVGSADLMPRNLDNRVEVLVKIKSAKLKTTLKQALDLAIADNSSAWLLDSDGSWNHARRRSGEAIVDFQAELMRRARANG